MLFNSFDFLVFFPVVTALFFMLPHKFRWFLLLAASCYFYMCFKPVYILILFGTIIIDYFAGIYIDRAQDKKIKKRFLVLSLIANIGILAVFKYFNFFNYNLSALLGSVGKHNPIPYLEIILPIGLSFHTFQAMSYTIEVYRGNQKPETHFGIYALYVMFYPQLVAGPIERPQNILHQFHEKKYFNYQLAVSGLRLMLWGFFKKMVIADNIGVIADNVFNNPGQQNSFTFLTGAFCFTIQIYCDFSGYSDIAIGSARVMGYELMRNFNVPYIARSIRDFWTRWHISLSTWFRDYLYIPLGGSRVGKLRKYINVYIVFLVSGFWHGASWNFVIWGGLHGLFLLIYDALEKNKFNLAFRKSFLYVPLSVSFTFLLVMITWIFFRVTDSALAFKITKTIFFGWKDFITALKTGGSVFSGLMLENKTAFLSLLMLVVVFYMLDALKEKQSLRRTYARRPALRYASYFILIFSILIFSHMEETAFIYFQF